MNIAIVGFGRMGQKIKELAENRGHTIDVIVDPVHKEATCLNLSQANLEKVDIIIDFSLADAVLKNIKIAAKAGKNIIIGTTGWYDQLEELEKIVKENNIGALWSANFSIGVNLFYRAIEKTAELFNKYEEYDIWGTELHHNNKADSPSGTAKELSKILLEKLSRKNKVVYDKLDRKIKPNEIHFSSTRGGAINFSHTISFDSPSDTVTLNHNARNRDGYVLGAIKAAEWLLDKKGLFTMNDFLNNK